jgi:2-polyprenyl-3-methyl-5-hydroxy-6-metoxy-1,4-benzoquinol methylase
VYYLNPRPATRELAKIYPASDYYSYDFSEKSNAVTRRARLARDLQKVRAVTRLAGGPRQEMRVLDVGAGDGALLDAFAAEGYSPANLYGVEMDERATGTMSAKGYRALNCRIEDMRNTDLRFDAVTMIQLIEHVAEPRRVLQMIRQALHPNGVLIIETPNMGSWDRRLFRSKLWGGYHFPRHWTLWDKRSLCATLEQCGFTPIEISTPPAAVLWAWTLNHAAQEFRLGALVERLFTMNNPLVLGMLWGLEFVPSALGISANMRVIARASRSQAGAQRHRATA